MQAKPSSAPVNINSVATAKSVLHTLFGITREWNLSTSQGTGVAGCRADNLFSLEIWPSARGIGACSS